MKKIFFLCLLTTVALASSPVCVGPNAPANFVSNVNQSYKIDLGMDIYTPASAGAHYPVAFLIHGGGWVEGDKADLDGVAQQLTAMGYAGVSVSYTLANNNTGKFPQPVEDLRCALKTMHVHADDWHLNMNQVVAIGFSAGAHLAAEIALTADSVQFDDSECPVQNAGDVEVQGVIGYYGPYDLRSSIGLNSQQVSLLTNFLGGYPELMPTEASLASPIAQVKGQQLPILLAQAVNDDTVPVKSSRDFSAALLAAHTPVKYVELSDGAHTLSLFDNRPFAQASTCASLDYLTKFQKGQNPFGPLNIHTH